MPDPNAEAAPSKVRIVSDDDFEALGHEVARLMTLVHGDKTGQVLPMYHRMRHILLRIDGAQE